MKIWKNTKTLDEYLDNRFKLVDQAEAELAIVGGKPIHFDQFPRLKGIFKCGVGKDNLPYAEASARGVEIRIASSETSEIVFKETANFACHLILEQAYANAGQLDGWVKNPRRFLGDQNLLVIGAGHIGSRVAHVMAPLFNVEKFDAITHQPKALEAMIRRADFVSLHIPLMPSTTGFIDEEKLSWMKTGAVLVNTARGPVVDENALLSEIASGRLRATFDVFWQEPYTGPLREYHPSQFKMSPHLASTCSSFLTGLTADLVEFGRSLKLC